MPRAIHTAFYAFTIAVWVLLANAVATDAADRSSRLAGASGHVTEGSARIAKRADGVYLELGGDFSFDGAPDPKWAFGTAGRVDRSTIFAPLARNAGTQSYRVLCGASGSPCRWVWQR